MGRPGHSGLSGGMRRPKGEGAGAVASLPKGGRSCWDLPARLGAGSLATGLAGKVQASAERAVPSPARSCRAAGMILPRVSLVPLHPRRLRFLWFLFFVLPAIGVRGAGDVILYL